MARPIRPIITSAIAPVCLVLTACTTRPSEHSALEGSDLIFCDGKRVVLCYRHEPSPFKPYVRELSTPCGINVLLDGPPDHAHHHGLMFALGVDDIDFWGEEPPDKVGRQEPGPSGLGITGEDAASCDHHLIWRSPDGTALLQEQRSLTIVPVSGRDVTLVTWRTTLSPGPGRTSAQLWGHHYFGLGMRFVHDMDQATTFVFADDAVGAVFRGDERLTPARWCAARGVIDGHPVTVAMLDHPDNPRHPATWFTMSAPFAYLSATMNLHERPYTLERGKSLSLRYGIALFDGHVAIEQIESISQHWVNGVASDVQPPHPVETSPSTSNPTAHGTQP